MLVQLSLKFIGQLLTPSWLSGLIAVILALGVVTGAAASLRYNSSDIRFLHDAQSGQPAISDDSSDVSSQFSTNELISDIPLFVLWAGVGALAYSAVMKIIASFGSAVSFRNELGYVHVNRQQLIRDALLKFAFRAAILILWILYIEFTIHVLVPYVIALAYAGAGGAGWLPSAGYLVGAAVLMAIAVHLHAVMLRLVLLRPRAFGGIA